MKGSEYRRIKGSAYTRREYIHGVPPPRLSKHTMGNLKGKFDYKVSMTALRDVQIRHNALEAARVAVNKVLFDKLGETGYRLRVKVYPHQVLRENKMMAFAGADRIQEGMRKSFGVPIGTAARVRINQPIMTAEINADAVEAAKEALMQGFSKLPTPCKIEVKKIAA
mgnify:CR=1 FL=1